MTALENGDDTILKIVGLEATFSSRLGLVKVLDGVNLEVRRGETVGVVGESGSGKTMTALAIMRLLSDLGGRIVSGEIWFKGENLVTKSDAEMTRIRGREIAMIPQDPMTSLNPLYTIGNQLAESVRMNAGMSASDTRKRSVELLDRVRIAHPEARLREYPHRLSGGMRQRVVGAIALGGGPELLLADEPTTSLDATVQLQYLELLKEIQADTGIAILFITHDFGVVAKMCDQVAVMYAGKIVEFAPVRELFDHPVHPYTRALIQSLPRVDQDVAVLPSIPGQPPDLTDLPRGCAFAPRCADVMPHCEEAAPPWSQVAGEAHGAACWKLVEIGREAR